MREEDIVKAEDMKMKELTTEEVAARRAELRQMRELMFRADIKAKRVAKIKSKTYRRIQKKERQKNQLGLDELDQLDPEAAEAERMKMEAERAKERATMRHKNTGKWAKAMLARGGDLDVDQRREILEQLNRGEMLRKKIHGTGPDDESEGSDGDDMGVEQIKAAAFDELTNLARGDSAEVPQQRGLFEMKFMKDAMAREQRRADELIDDFKSELRHLGNDPQEGTDDEADAAGPQAIGGRMSFRPGTVKVMFLHAGLGPRSFVFSS
jgi:U3 small nucleolar RNA-associated protein 14